MREAWNRFLGQIALGAMILCIFGLLVGLGILAYRLVDIEWLAAVATLLFGAWFVGFLAEDIWLTVRNRERDTPGERGWG